MIKVSIIVPVYKTEAYLEKCLDSLVKQTLDNIEIIVVNDGSPDGSQAIIDSFVARFPDRVLSYQKANGGLSSARNFGIDRAHGTYVGFVDSDDWIEINTFELLYNKAIEKNFDMTVCDVLFVYPDHEIRVDSGINHDVCSQQKIKKSFTTIFPAAWNKLYRKSLFEKGFQFKEGIWFEDVEFIFKALAHVQSIGVVHQPLIHYLQRENAITKTFNVRLNDYISNWEGIIAYYRANDLFEKYKKELEYNYVRYLLGTFLKNASKSASEDFFHDSIELAFTHVERQFADYRKNIYFYQNGFRGIYLVMVNRTLASFLRRIRFRH